MGLSGRSAERGRRVRIKANAFWTSEAPTYSGFGPNAFARDEYVEIFIGVRWDSLGKVKGYADGYV